MPPGHGTQKNVLVLRVKYQPIKLTKGTRTASDFSAGVEQVGGEHVPAFLDSYS